MALASHVLTTSFGEQKTTPEPHCMGLRGCALSWEGIYQVLSWKAVGAQVKRIFQFTFVYRECSVCAGTPLQLEQIKVWFTELSGNSITRRFKSMVHIWTNMLTQVGLVLTARTYWIQHLRPASNSYHYLKLNMLRAIGYEIKICEEN